MRIQVTKVGDPWKATPTSDPMWTIHITGQGEPQRTYDPLLAQEGEHEAETFKSKAGKEYWRTPKGAATSTTATPTKSYSADPVKLKQEFALEVAKNQSIQRQVALKACVELICYSKRDYSELAQTFHDAMALLYPGYERTDEVEKMVDDGDFAKTTHESDDLPPVDLYDESIAPHA